jgi:uncharacterized membrane protein YhiD involved in acid resistance
MADRKVSGPRRATVLVAVVAALVGFALVALLLWAQRSGPPTPSAGDAARTQTGAPGAGEQAAPAAAPAEQGERTAASPRATSQPRIADDDGSLLSIFGIHDEEPATPTPQRPQDWMTTFASVTIKLTLAALLSALLAFRPRRFALFYKRNPFVAQTQILLAVVASALMMIVGDSAARAFGIFAAVSLVRFRTNIKDPKEITVLLVSLAIGLATGVGRWELAVILSFFVLLLLWGLEYREPESVFRAMELTVKTRNVDQTQDMLLRLFRRYNFDAEIRTIDRPDGEDEVGCIIYYVNVSPLVSTDRLSEEILTADSHNVDSVEWDQQKNASLYYQ